MAFVIDNMYMVVGARLLGRIKAVNLRWHVEHIRMAVSQGHVLPMQGCVFLTHIYISLQGCVFPLSDIDVTTYISFPL